MSTSLKDGVIQTAIFNFDVHGDKSLYGAVYKALGPHAVRYGSDSSSLIPYSHKAVVEGKMAEINQGAALKGRKGVEYRTRRTHPDEASEIREDSINELHKSVAFITQSMLDRIERLEKKFNEQVDDVNEMISKRNDAIAKARRQIDEARGVAMLFMIDKDVTSAVEAAKAVADAQASVRDALKEQYAENIQKLKAAAKARRLAGAK